MEIELTDARYYRGGQSGATVAVGNDTYAGTPDGRRVARYTFTAPAVGASLERITFLTGGRSGGDSIPVRFYIGTDPEDHANAGPEDAYTGELVLAADGKTFTGSGRAVLLPGKTYYLWVFPGVDAFGWYSWGYEAEMDATGGACVVPVVKNGEIENRLLAVAKGGKLWLCMPVAVIGGKPWIVGAGGETT